jgi:NAD(P)-dependent dehydrogenase (short-subunit alcohol dehydrogenase family)
MMGSSGRVVAVVGGAGGIGGAIARAFAANGDRVAVLDLAPSLERVPEGMLAVPVDLDSLEGVQASFDVVTAELGPVQVLVNSAGIFRRGSLLETSADDWDLVQRINTRGVLLAMQAVVPTMLEHGIRGSIVNLASMAAKKGGGMEGAYAASKAGVVALTRAGAWEWGSHGITVNAICPGYVLTEMGAATRTAADVESWCGQSPLGRLGDPDDVAGVALFLASPAATYLTGQAVNVTGGMVMH